MTSKDFNVAIVGGGMCGLTCAVGLLRAGIHIDIFESAPKFEEVGAGVGLGPNAVRALDALGLLEAVMARSDERELSMRTFRFLSGMPGHEEIYDYPGQPDDVGIGIHRAAFLDALVSLVDPSVTHFNKRATSVLLPSKPGSRYILQFADGTTHETDVVIGADGIKSAMRKTVARQEASRPIFTNTVAYRGLVKTRALEEAGIKTDLSERPVCWTGADRHIITFPIKGGETINIVAFATNRAIPFGSVELTNQPWVERVPEQELLDVYQGCGDDVSAVVKCIHSPSKWSIHAVHPPLESYINGKVVLIGDAAHGMLPHLGAGVGQGIEDCLVLTRLLGDPRTTLSNVEDVLKAYNQVRPARANSVLRRSQEVGDIYEGEGSKYNAQEIRQHVTGIWDFVWHYDVMNDIDSALVWLQENGSFNKATA